MMKADGGDDGGCLSGFNCEGDGGYGGGDGGGGGGGDGGGDGGYGGGGDGGYRFGGGGCRQWKWMTCTDIYNQLTGEGGKPYPCLKCIR